ncbi:MAG: polyprenyl synthetase family protein [Planctomycetota bacterium]
MSFGSGETMEQSSGRSGALMELFQHILEDIGALREFLHSEFSSSEPFVNELLQHLSRFQGKQVRPACLFLSGRCFGEIETDHIKCAAVVELIHTATLVHDDLLDQAAIRRRVETIHSRYGDRAAILLGDIIYARGFVISTEVEGAARLLADCTRDICIGEMLQVGNAGNLLLSQEQYFEIIHRKTAILYGLSCRLGALLAGANPDQVAAMEKFGNQLGVAFQIVDDSLDVLGDPETVGKSLGTDLVNGKMTLPIILLRDGLDSDQRDSLLDLLGNHREPDPGPEFHREVVRRLEQFEIFEQVRKKAQDSIDSAIASLHEAAPESQSRNHLEQLAHFVLEREL